MRFEGKGWPSCRPFPFVELYNLSPGGLAFQTLYSAQAQVSVPLGLTPALVFGWREHPNTSLVSTNQGASYITSK